MVTRLAVVVLFIVLAVGGTADDASTNHRGKIHNAICHTFKKYCDEALAVTWCESRWNVWAQNGQYLGLFQMGSWERKTYGHGNDAWEQSRAAYRYFVASGKDWSPWSCKPW